MDVGLPAAGAVSVPAVGDGMALVLAYGQDVAWRVKGGPSANPYKAVLLHHEAASRSAGGVNGKSAVPAKGSCQAAGADGRRTFDPETVFENTNMEFVSGSGRADSDKRI